MKKLLLMLAAVFLTTTLFSQGNRHYITNQKPLVAQPYTALPIGEYDHTFFEVLPKTPPLLLMIKQSIRKQYLNKE